MAMKIVQSNQAPEFDNSLIFNSGAYIKLQEFDGLRSYQIIGSNSAAVVFSLKGTTAICLDQTPYAGIQVTERVSETDICHFVRYFIEDLRTIGITQIIIKHWPQFIDRSHDLLVVNCLRAEGFTLKSTEINHHFVLGDGHRGSVHKMEQRKIRKCLDAGLSFRERPVKDLADCYEFLSRCRHQQGLNINITYSKLERTFAVLPKSYSIHAVEDRSGEIFACTIVVNVNERVAYNYLPAFDRAHRKYSPMALLYEGLWHHFSEKGFKILDLGVSSIDGVPQDGLIKFKEHMGAVPSDRHVFQYLI